MQNVRLNASCALVIVGILHALSAHAQIGFVQCSASAAGLALASFANPGSVSYNSSITLPDEATCSINGFANPQGASATAQAVAVSSAGASTDWTISNNSFVFTGSGTFEGEAQAIADNGLPGGSADAVSRGSATAGFSGITLAGNVFDFNLLVQVDGGRSGTNVSYNLGSQSGFVFGNGSGNTVTEDITGVLGDSAVTQFGIGGQAGSSIDLQAGAQTSPTGVGASQTTIGIDSYTYTLTLTPIPTPLPSATWLLLSGLAILGLMTRRRKLA